MINREILFRGKRKSDGEWIFGNLLQTNNDGICIIQNHIPQHLLKKYEIDPKTVCRYTGLIDKNGRKIFEGDIVKHFNYPGDDEKYVLGCIKWNRDYCQFMKQSEDQTLYSVSITCRYEVIGNIFDNPELIGLEESSPNDGWISCSERLPEEPKELPTEEHFIEQMILDDEFEEYIVTVCGAKKATTLYYVGAGKWYDIISSEYYKVAAWQPLPTGYEALNLKTGSRTDI